MVLHLFTQVSDYSIEFLKMLVKKFNTADHVVVFRSRNRESEAEAVWQEALFLSTRKDVISLLTPLLYKADRIVFHSFPVSRSLFFWIRYRRIMKKSIWAVWGQDAYWYKYCRKMPEEQLYELLRGLLIKRLDAIICPIYNDYRYITDHYKTTARYMNGMYPIPTDFDLLRSLRNFPQRNDCIHIQVGNSANPTNNTLEILQVLARHQEKNFQIFCPISYGDPHYAELVLKTGKGLFGDRFNALTRFLDRTEYANFVAGIDILIMNHQRQQGLGNIFSYLYLGKKVYIRGDNSSFSFFGQHGIQVYDTSKFMVSLDEDELLKMDPAVSELNMQKTEELLSLDTISAGWAQILK